jgi:hypothetical protein
VTRSVDFVLTLKTVSESNARGHWSRRHRRAAEQRAVARMRCAVVPGWPLTLPVVVTLIRTSKGSLDDDNLRGALKAVRDGVADALGIDDRDPCVRWDYAQKRGTYGVEVRIAEQCTTRRA